MSVTNAASPMSSATHSSRWVTISILCFIFFFVAVVISHLIRTDRNLTTHFLSEYVVGPNGFVMTSALTALGVGLLAMTGGLWRNGAATTYTRIGLVLLGMAGSAMLVVVSFPTNLQYTPVTQSALIHDGAALIFFCSVIAAIALISFGFQSHGLWQKYYRSEAILALLALVAFLVFFTIYPLQMGTEPLVPMLANVIEIWQRVLFLCIWLWLLVTALRLQDLMHKVN